LEEFDQWSSGKYRGVKRDIYEGGHRVPFIVKWPGKISQKAVSDEVVSQVDLAATFAKIIDYPLGKKEAIDSYNLLPVLSRKEIFETFTSCHRPEHLAEKVRPSARRLGTD